jgi:hypothetical protein
MGTHHFFKALLFTSVCWASLAAGAAAEPPLNRKQSTIILYGIVDTGVGYTTTSAPNYSQGASAQGTRFGMSSGAQSGSR